MISVDFGKCIQCGRCIAVCPARIYSWDGFKEEKTVLIQDESNCIICGHCVAICPEDAIIHEQLPLEDFQLLDIVDVTPEALSNLLLSRRSIRVYRPDPVPKEVLEKLLNVAVHAGTASNQQNVKFTVVQQPDLLFELEDLVVENLWNQLKRYGNPLFRKRDSFRYTKEQLQVLIRYHDFFKRRIKSGETRGTIIRGAPAAIILSTPGKTSLLAANCALAIANMTMLAQTLELGVCWVGFLVEAASREPRIKKLLGIPDYRHVHGCLVVGYPRYTYKKSIPRKPPRVDWF
ncbi:MAG: nitroreductase family protein [Candidatus Odinarchaeota archaeon]